MASTDSGTETTEPSGPKRGWNSWFGVALAVSGIVYFLAAWTIGVRFLLFERRVADGLYVLTMGALAGLGGLVCGPQVARSLDLARFLAGLGLLALGGFLMMLPLIPFSVGWLAPLEAAVACLVGCALGAGGILLVIRSWKGILGKKRGGRGGPSL